MSGLKPFAEREVSRMKRVFASVKLEKPDDERARKLFELASAYQKDSEHFLAKGKMVEAFEAAVISWAYVDAGLHLKVFVLDDEELEKELFTTK